MCVVCVCVCVCGGGGVEKSPIISTLELVKTNFLIEKAILSLNRQFPRISKFTMVLKEAKEHSKKYLIRLFGIC